MIPEDPPGREAWDLSEMSARGWRAAKSGLIGGFLVGGAFLAFAAFVGLRLVTLPSTRNVVGYSGFSFLFVVGMLWIWVAYRNYGPGATRVSVDSGGVQFEYPSRRDRNRVLRWESPTFSLALRKDANPQGGGKVYCLERPVGWVRRWPQSDLTEDAFLGIVEAARMAGMKIAERKTFSGWRTWVNVGPRTPTQRN